MNASLIAEGWELAQRYYAKNVWKCPKTFIREVLWDAVVDALLQTLREFDGSMDFRQMYLQRARQAWFRGLRWARRERRRLDLESEWKEDRGKRIPDYRAPGDELVEGRDLYLRLLPLLEPRQRARVTRWLWGESESDIARSEGASRQTTHARIRTALGTMRKAV